MEDREPARERPATPDDAVQPAPPGTEFLTVKQTAEYLNVSPSIVYRLCLTRRLSHYKFGEGGAQYGSAGRS
jgi:excisionase family DNA binding protein